MYLMTSMSDKIQIIYSINEIFKAFLIRGNIIEISTIITSYNDHRLYFYLSSILNMFKTLRVTFRSK